MSVTVTIVIVFPIDICHYIIILLKIDCLVSLLNLPADPVWVQGPVQVDQDPV